MAGLGVLTLVSNYGLAMLLFWAFVITGVGAAVIFVVLSLYAWLLDKRIQRGYAKVEPHPYDTNRHIGGF